MTPKEMLKLTIDLLTQAGPQGWTKATFWRVDGRSVDVNTAKAAPHSQACMIGRVVLETRLTIGEVDRLLIEAFYHQHSAAAVNDHAEDFTSLIITLHRYLEAL